MEKTRAEIELGLAFPIEEMARQEIIERDKELLAKCNSLLDERDHLREQVRHLTNLLNNAEGKLVSYGDNLGYQGGA